MKKFYALLSFLVEKTGSPYFCVPVIFLDLNSPYHPFHFDPSVYYFPSSFPDSPPLFWTEEI